MAVSIIGQAERASGVANHPIVNHPIKERDGIYRTSCGSGAGHPRIPSEHTARGSALFSHTRAVGGWSACVEIVLRK